MAFSWLRESQKKEQETGVSSRILCADCTQEDKIRMGCKGGAEFIVSGITIDRCPENYINEETIKSMTIWQDWKLFSFPFPGHWSEQPHYVIDSIRILESISRGN